MSLWDKKQDVQVSQTHAAPDVVDHALRADVKHRAPSQAIVAQALASKQEKISSSDEVPEGKKNLYFTAARAKEACFAELQDWTRLEIAKKQDPISDSDDIAEGHAHLFFSPDRALASVSEWVEVQIQDAFAKKQDPISSTDDVKEGSENLYFTPKRAQEASVTQAVQLGNVGNSPSSDAVAKALSLKQDVIKSTDDLSEGVRNKFCTRDAIQAVMSDEISMLKKQIDGLARIIIKLEAEIEDLKPKWTDQFKGGSGEVRCLIGVSGRGAISQTLRFKSGSLIAIEGPVMAPIEVK